MRLGAVLLAVVVFTLDLASKQWIQRRPLFDSYSVVEGFFRIRYVRNRGIAFGLFHSVESEWKMVLLVAMALVAILCVLYYLWVTPATEVVLLTSLGLLLGGIVGNLVDRLRHDYVIDFLELHWGTVFTWPTFNIADVAITGGVFLIFLDTFLAGGAGSRSRAGEEVISGTRGSEPE